MAGKPRRFDAGCVDYLECDVTVHIAFPADMVICDICEFCRTENNGTRYRCLLNSKILPYHNKGVGMYCPLPLREQMTVADSEEDD